MSSRFIRLPVLVGVLSLALGLSALAPQLASAATGVTDVWSGLGDGESWSDGANWSTNHAPMNGDSVYVAPPSVSRCYAAVTGIPDGVALQDFTMTEFAPSAGSSCFASVDGGSISVAGSFTVHSGVVGTAFTLPAGSAGTITPYTGFADTTDFNADLTVHSTLTLDGNVDDADGNDRAVDVNDGHSLIIAADGVLDATHDNVSSTACCSPTSHLVNNGVVRVEGGQLRVQAAEFDQNAQLDTPSAGQLITSRAPQTAGDGATYTGTGSWVNSETSTTTLIGTQNLGSSFRFVLGDAAAGGNETLNGTATLAGTGTFDWAGGKIAANLTIAHGVKMTASGNVAGDGRQLAGSDDLTLTNHGTITLAGHASCYATSNGRIDNASDGVLNFGAGTSVDGDCCQPGGSIANNGGRVNLTNNVAVDPVVLHNVAYLQTGGSTSIPAMHELMLTGGATSTFASATVTGGGTLQLSASGTVTKSLNVGTDTTLQLTAGGSLTSAGATASKVKGAGAFAWTGGSIAGSVTLTTTAGVAVSGTAGKTLDAFNNAPSSLTITAPTTIAHGTSAAPDQLNLVNDSRLTLAGPTTVGYDVTFSHGHLVNNGTLTVQATATHPVYVSAADLTNRGSMVVTGLLKVDNGYLQTAGSSTINRGATLNIVGSGASARINAGTFGGLGQVSGSVTNAGGQLQPGSTQIGTLTISGDYAQTSSASARIKVGANSFDLVSVGGKATVRGELAFVNVGFSPAAGDQRTILTAASRPNVQASCTTTTGPGSTVRHWVPTLSSTSLVITSVAGTQPTC